MEEHVIVDSSFSVIIARRSSSLKYGVDNQMMSVGYLLDIGWTASVRPMTSSYLLRTRKCWLTEIWSVLNETAQLVGTKGP